LATNINPHTAETQPLSSSNHLTTIVNSLRKLQATSNEREVVVPLSAMIAHELPHASLFLVAASSTFLHP